jgi:CheY-like chemotaxis protein
MGHGSILLFGNDERLLETRQWVLESTGYRVWAAASLEEVDRISAKEPLDLLILCHSLTPEAYEQALAIVAPRQPKVHVLVMSSAASGHSFGPREQRLDATAGPSVLVDAVTRVLGSECGRTGMLTDHHPSLRHQRVA